MAKKKKERVVVFLEVEVSDNIVQQLKSADPYETDKTLIDYIKHYREGLENQGIEVFDSGNTYLVCEKFVCVAAYEDELKK